MFKRGSLVLETVVDLLVESGMKEAAVRSELDALKDIAAKKAFGISRTEAHQQGICVQCRKPAVEFRDERSKREWSVTAFCQTCQDALFGEGDE